jgi:membrane-associated phospholipid phosphatase
MLEGMFLRGEEQDLLLGRPSSESVVSWLAAFAAPADPVMRGAILILSSLLLALQGARADDLQGTREPTAEPALRDLPLPDLPSADAVDVFAARERAAASTPYGRAAAGAPRLGADPCLFCADYWSVLKGDVKHVLTSPARWEGSTWRSVGFRSLAVVGLIGLADGRTRDYVDEHKSPESNRVAADFRPFGREYAAYVIGGFLFAGDLMHSPRAKAVAVDGFSSTVISGGLIVPALKEIAGRSRPREGRGTRDFNPFSGGYSFPSGHSVAAFSVAASVAEHYDARWVKGLAYGTASMVAYDRVEEGAHFLSDVSASAMIGIGVAHAVRRFNEGGRGRLSIRVGGDAGFAGTRGIDLGIEVPLR